MTPKAAKKEQDTHKARDSNAHEGAAVDLVQVFFTGNPRVKKTVTAGKGDIAANTAANKGYNTHDVNFSGMKVLERANPMGGWLVNAT